MAGQLLVAIVTAILARRLSVGAFEIYAIAAAVFVVLVVVAPLGADKLAAQLLPAPIAAADRARVVAIVGFALRRALIGTLVLGVAGALLGLASATPGLAPALSLAMAALPPAVVAHLSLEVLAAAGRPLWPMIVLKVGVPATALLVLGLATGPADSATFALVAWGIGWCVAALVLRASLRRTLPGIPLRPAARPPATGWSEAARALWLHRLVTAAMAQAGILALALVGAPAVEVGAYAAATALAGLPLALSTSTSRPYTRTMALLLADGRPQDLRPLARRRLLWLLPALAVPLLPMLVVPGRAVGLFSPEFAQAGTAALRLLSVAVAFNASLALSVTLLKLDGRARLLSRAAVTTLGAQILLLGLLAPPFGAAGVAAAYATATVGQSIALTARAWRSVPSAA